MKSRFSKMAHHTELKKQKQKPEDTQILLQEILIELVSGGGPRHEYFGCHSAKQPILLFKLFTIEMFKHIQTQWEYFNEPQVPITKLQ